MKRKHIFVISGIALIVLVSVTLIALRIFSAEKNTESVLTDVPALSVPSSNSIPQSVPPAAKPISIRLGIWPDSASTDEVKLAEGYAEKMRQIFPNVRIVPAPCDLSNFEAFQFMAQSKTLPTVFSLVLYRPNNQFPFDYAADITEELAARGWDKAMNPKIKDLLSKDGKIYGIPADGYALGLMMNAELFEKAGLTAKDGSPIYPKTTDELIDAAQKIKKATGKAGLCLPVKDIMGSWQFTQIAWNFGAQLCSENNDGTFTANLDSPEAIAAMQFVKDLKWKFNVLTDQPEKEDWNTAFTALGKGDAAMCIAANDAVDQPTKLNGLAPDKLAMCAFPAGPKGDAYCLTSGTMYAFSKDAAPDEINACLDYLELAGKSPVETDAVLAQRKTDFANRKASGIPVLPRFPLWTDKTDPFDAIPPEYSNVSKTMFQPFFQAITEPTPKLRLEEPGSASSLYLELVPVLQKVVTDKNANVETLMKKADLNLQLALNQQYRK